MEKVSSDRKSRRSRYFSTGRSRTTRRSQIFRCNHLLDFENFWKKVSDRKRRRSRYFSTGRSRTTRRSQIFRCNHLLDFENFWKKCPPTERAADRGFFPSDRREHSPGLGIFYRDRLFREEVTLQWKKEKAGRGSLWPRSVEKHPRTRVSLVTLGREASADEGFAGEITFWTLKIFQSPW